MKFEIFGWLKNLQSLILHAKIVNIQRMYFNFRFCEKAEF